MVDQDIGQGIVFKIRVPADKGIDVNVARAGKQSGLHFLEEEVAIVGRIEPKDIIGYYTIKSVEVNGRKESFLDQYFEISPE